MIRSLLLSTILVLLAINLAKATAFGTATTRTVETNLFQCYKIEKNTQFGTLNGARVGPALEVL